MPLLLSMVLEPPVLALAHRSGLGLLADHFGLFTAMIVLARQSIGLLARTIRDHHQKR